VFKLCAQEDSFGWNLNIVCSFALTNETYVILRIGMIALQIHLCSHLNAGNVRSHYKIILLKIIFKLFWNKVVCSSSEFQSQQLHISTYKPCAGWLIKKYPINKAVPGWPLNTHWHMLSDSANFSRYYHCYCISVSTSLQAKRNRKATHWRV